MKECVLKLTEYQAANLRWLLCLIWEGKTPGLNTGDWCGEIRWALEQEMIEHEVTALPNVRDYWPPLQGWFNGRKRLEAISGGAE